MPEDTNFTTGSYFRAFEQTGTESEVIPLPYGANRGFLEIDYTAADYPEDAEYTGDYDLEIEVLDADGEYIDGYFDFDTYDSYRGMQIFGMYYNAEGERPDAAALRVTQRRPGRWRIRVAPLSDAQPLPANGQGDGVYRLDKPARRYRYQNKGGGNLMQVVQYADGNVTPTWGYYVNEGKRSKPFEMLQAPSIIEILHSGTWSMQEHHGLFEKKR